MDEKPFLELDMLNLQDSVLAELKKLSKIAFNLDEVLTTANELKYTRGIMNILAEQLQSPSDEFVKLFFSALRPGKPFMGKAKESFADFTKRAFKQFIREQLNSLIKEASELADTRVATAATLPSIEVAAEVATSESSERQISTTEEELEAFYIVKSIVREVVDPSRIFHRDTLSYFGILLDDNNRKPICRLHLNSPQNKKISLFNPGQGEKQEEKIAIAALNDIYKYADRIKATVTAYET